LTTAIIEEADKSVNWRYDSTGVSATNIATNATSYKAWQPQL